MYGGSCFFPEFGGDFASSSIWNYRKWHFIYLFRNQYHICFQTSVIAISGMSITHLFLHFKMFCFSLHFFAKRAISVYKRFKDKISKILPKFLRL